MIKIIKQILKKTRYYDNIRSLYLVFFRKGFLYHYIQKFIVEIRLRKFLGKIEKKIINFLNRKTKKEMEKYINLENINAINLKTKGATEPFVIKSFI